MKQIAEQFVLADGSPWDQSNYLLTLHTGVAKDSTVDYSKQLSNTTEFEILKQTGFSSSSLHKQVLENVLKSKR